MPLPLPLIKIEVAGHEPLTCRAILFDMDGVLVDSTATIDRHIREWVAQRGLDLHQVLDAAPGRTNTELVAEVAPFLDARAEAAMLLKKEVEDLSGIAACAGAAELVGLLPEGSWAVVTSAHLPLAHARLRASGLPVPEVLITADDVRVGKPAPEGYLSAAGHLGFAPGECVVIEDAAAGLAAAYMAGIPSIAIEGPDGRPHAPSARRVASLAALKVRLVEEETANARETITTARSR